MAPQRTNTTKANRPRRSGAAATTAVVAAAALAALQPNTPPGNGQQAPAPAQAPVNAALSALLADDSSEDEAMDVEQGPAVDPAPTQPTTSELEQEGGVTPAIPQVPPPAGLGPIEQQADAMDVASASSVPAPQQEQEETPQSPAFSPPEENGYPAVENGQDPSNDAEFAAGQVYDEHDWDSILYGDPPQMGTQPPPPAQTSNAAPPAAAAVVAQAPSVTLPQTQAQQQPQLPQAPPQLVVPPQPILHVVGVAPPAPFQGHAIPPHLAVAPRTTTFLGKVIPETALAVIDAVVLTMVAVALFPTDVFATITEATRTFWISVPGPKLLVFVSYLRNGGRVPQQVIERILTALRMLVPDDEAAGLMVYTSEMLGNTAHGSPKPFLLAGASKPTMDALAALKIASTTDITLTMLSVRAPASGWVGTLEKAHLAATEGDTIIKLISSYIRQWREFHVWLGQVPARYDAIPIGMVQNGAIEWIVGSITVTPLTVLNSFTGEPEVVWGVSLTPFSTSQACMDEFRVLTKRIKIHALEISGVCQFKRTDFNCSSCRGRDHPTGLCPLKTVPGFFDHDPNPHTAQNAPTAETVAPQPANDDDDEFIPGLHAPQNNNLSRGHFTSPARGRGGQTPCGGRGQARGRGASRGGYGMQGPYQGGW
ncbi:hypothetical protein DFP72DRAFT_1146969 [Ephemerocybe angulata]|uniref:Uncharacterized protein n=1 Tax=Ephemerocybe angulata TaxID=980116 RepID=A0A8H6LZN5_9AGAR|nr:hypothetical protein DFP72DRAFT_1146969 [Tulosesus angulatus]